MKHTFTIVHEGARARAIAVINTLDTQLPHEVVIRPKKDSRSLRQNSTFHGWCTFISAKFAEATGKFAPPTWWKEYFKDMFLGEESFEVNGKIITRTRHTADLDVKDMAAFMTQVDHYCGSEFQIFVPLPREQGEANGAK